jgi:hypothetical protein
MEKLSLHWEARAILVSPMLSQPGPKLQHQLQLVRLLRLDRRSQLQLGLKGYCCSAAVHRLFEVRNPRAFFRTPLFATTCSVMTSFQFLEHVGFSGAIFADENVDEAVAIEGEREIF